MKHAVAALSIALAGLTFAVAACDGESDGEAGAKPAFGGGTVSGPGASGTSKDPTADSGRSFADAKVGEAAAHDGDLDAADAADNDAQDP